MAIDLNYILKGYNFRIGLFLPLLLGIAIILKPYKEGVKLSQWTCWKLFFFLVLENRARSFSDISTKRLRRNHFKHRAGH